MQLNALDEVPLPLYDIDELVPDQGTSLPLPLYDIDQLVANLTLEDPPTTPTKPKRKKESEGPPPASPPAPPPIAAPPGYSAHNPSAAPSPLYHFESPTKAGYTRHWSEAAHATQGIPNSRAQALNKPPKTRGSKKAAYVVFQGRSTGVFLSWAEVERVTSRLRFAVYQGYSSVEQATAAFDLVQRRGWTCDSVSWSASPLPASSAPSPIPEDAEQAPAPLFPRAHDRYYVVFAGLNPGVFGTNVECALNVLGIPSCVHHSVDCYQQARDMFREAKARGEVFAREARSEV
ncbi:hypothetical protein B0H13DRAFT_2355299 [Mycena leptocephala]|nr:hypothetical protein B0H13DRAFT_2355299 [Mycena leptocephala]